MNLEARVYHNRSQRHTLTTKQDSREDEMSEPAIEGLGRRLDRVERENRRLKRAGMAALAVMTAVVLVGQTTGRLVDAEKFILRDWEGKKRAELMTISSGAYLGLDGPDGKTRITLTVLDEPILTLYGQGEGAGAIRVLLGVNDVDSPYVKLVDKDGKVIWSAP